MAKTPADAYQRYHDNLCKSIRCLTNVHVVNNKHAVPGSEIDFAFSGGSVELKGSPFSFFLLQRVKVIQPPELEGAWKVKTLAYEYAIELTSPTREIIAFHWDSASDIGPHIHIGLTGKAQHITNKHHIPSGRILLEDVVRFLIDELGVPPNKTQVSTYRTILAEMKALVLRFKTW